MDIEKPQWCVVHTQPRAESRAECNLRLQGYTVFAPVIWKKVRHARQFKPVQVPLFPRYIFVKLDLAHQLWRSINGTGGVSGLITILDRPLPLPEGLVEELIALEASRSPNDINVEFHVDEPVQIGRSAFADLIGRIDRIDDKGRVQVLLDIMGRSVPVRTTLSELRPMHA